MSILARMLADEGVREPEAFCADLDSPPEVLVMLAQQPLRHPDPLGKILAANPSVPIQGLVDMIRLNAEQVILNPSFRIQMAADPLFLESIGRCNLARLVRTRGIDERLLRALAGPRSCDIFIRASAAYSPFTPIDMLEDYLRHHWIVRYGLAQNPVLPLHLQVCLSRDKKAEVRQILATHRDILPATLAQLIQPGGDDA